MAPSSSWSQWLTVVHERATPARCLPLFLVAAWWAAARLVHARGPSAPEDVGSAASFALGLAALAAFVPLVGAGVEKLARGPLGALAALALVPLLFVDAREVALAAPLLLVWLAWAASPRTPGVPDLPAPVRAFPWLASAIALELFRGLLSDALSGSAPYRAACGIAVLGAAVAFRVPRIGELAVAGVRRWPLALAVPVLLMLLAGPPGLGRAVGWSLAWGLWAAGARPGADLRRAWLGVLVVGLALRMLLVVGAPWPRWNPDSASYLLAVHDWLLGNPDAVLDASRTPVFPLLVIATVGTTGSYLAFLLCSHLIGLGVAWWAGRALRPVAGEVGGLACFAWLALFPKLIEHEHVLGPEALFVALLTVASVLAARLFTRTPVTPGLLEAIALGLSASLVVLARPAGLAILPVLGLAAVWRRLPLTRLAALALATLVPLLGWANYNRVHHGFFGLSRIGDQALFGVAGHLVDPDSPGFEDLKEEMRPGLARHAAARPFWNPDFNWLLFSKAGPLSGPRARALEQERYYEVVRAVALQAIRQRPVHFALRCAFEARVYVLQPEPTSLLLWPHPLEPAHDARVALQPPAARALVDTPLARGLGQMPLGPRAYDLAARASAITGAFPFHAAEQPIVALLLLVAAIGRRRERVTLLFLAGASLAMITVVCVLNEPLHRYHLQTVPLLTVGLCLVLGRVVHGSPGIPPAAPAPSTTSVEGPARRRDAAGSTVVSWPSTAAASGAARRSRAMGQRVALGVLLLVGGRAGVEAIADATRPPPWEAHEAAAPLFDDGAAPARHDNLYTRVADRWTFREGGERDVTWEVLNVGSVVRYRVDGGPVRRWRFAPLPRPAQVLRVWREALHISGRPVECLVVESEDRPRAFMPDVRRRTWVAVAGDAPTYPGVVREELETQGQRLVTREVVSVESR